jgi:plastocyanin
MQRLLVFFISSLLPVCALSGDLRARVNNDKGVPVPQAVVYARPLAGDPAAVHPLAIVIDQVDKEFVPTLSVIYRGAEVSFPNNDNIRHHVYSFSKSNAFEIPLYADQQAPPVTLANPGVVALGCNVHDWMSAYVFVSDTPYFAITDEAGQATLAGLPPGSYQVELWHVQLRGKPSKHRQTVDVAADAATAEVAFSIKQKRVWKAWRDSSTVEEDY